MLLCMFCMFFYVFAHSCTFFHGFARFCLFFHVFPGFVVLFCAFWLLGCFWALLGHSWGPLGRSWVALKAVSGRSWTLLGALGALLGRSWDALGAMLGLSCKEPRKNQKKPLFGFPTWEAKWSQNHQKSMSNANMFADSFFSRFFSNFHVFLDLNFNGFSIDFWTYNENGDFVKMELPCRR